MGCAASTVERAERRRRGLARARALGHSEASTTGLLAARQQGQEAESGGRRRGCKVAPEPKEQEEETSPALPAMPGSPSFRYYCQKAAAIDALVADANDSDGSVRTRETPQASKRNELTVTKAHKSSEVSKPREATRWLRFRGLAIVAAAWYNLFNRHSSKPSPPPAAKSHRPSPAPHPAARSHP